MNAQRLNKLTRILLVLCALALAATLFVPIWRIDLDAPQYPEGLQLLIFANKLGGNVDIVNGLNHYIGMKTLHANDFIEFTVLPYILGFFALLFLLVSISGRRKYLVPLLVLFIAFGVLAMYDFWRWEYNYGHNLNPDAAIIVPGMSYQPPLIGFKQLLNFGAFSVPAIGGWLIVSAGVLLILSIILSFRSRTTLAKTIAQATVGFALLVSLNGCHPAPEPVVAGKDNCYSCKMLVMDPRFVSEVITKKGKVYKFDDAHCLRSFLLSGEIKESETRDIYFGDFSNAGALVNGEKLFFLQSDGFKTPMNGNVAAFTTEKAMKETMKTFPGKELTFNLVVK